MGLIGVKHAMAPCNRKYSNGGKRKAKAHLSRTPGFRLSTIYIHIYRKGYTYHFTYHYMTSPKNPFISHRIMKMNIHTQQINKARTTQTVDLHGSFLIY